MSTETSVDSLDNATIEQWRATRLVVIRPASHSLRAQLHELWAYRELLYFLAWRDVKIRYKQAVFGIAWAILQPVLTMVLFTLLFGRLANVPSDGIPYALFAYAGLLQWSFFANAVTASGASLLLNTDLVTKVYFPRLLIPAGAVVAGLLDTCIAFVVFLGLVAYYGLALRWSFAALPFLVLLTASLALAVGGWMSALIVKYRDMRHTLPFAIQLWMFASPIIYPASLIPAQWRWVVALNPMTGIIEATRSALFGRPWNGTLLALSLILTVLALALSVRYFGRVEDSLADVI